MKNFFILLLLGLACLAVGVGFSKDQTKQDLYSILSEQGHIKQLPSGNVIVVDEEYLPIIKMFEKVEFNGEFGPDQKSGYQKRTEKVDEVINFVKGN